MARILIVEDEAKTAETVALYLRHAGYEVDVYGDGLRALEGFREQPADLVVLDLMLPGLDGLSLCRRLRAESDVRIVMLTARTAEDDRVRGLELGADDYVCKPMSPRELVARVRAVLRRTSPLELDLTVPLRWRQLEVDFAAHRARLGESPGVELRLTATEMELLATLMARPGRVFSRAELVQRVLGHDFEGDPRTIDAHVGNVRRKLSAADPALRPIETVFGVGYRLADEGGS
jgi:DNA-binding response OmpR family regulator